MGNFKKFLESLTDDGKNRAVARTVPAKKDWVEEFAALEELNREENVLAQKRKDRRAVLWAKINEALDAYTDDMHYNSKTKEIEILADEDD